MAKIMLSNGWCFKEAYDLNAMSHITNFTIRYGSNVFEFSDEVDWTIIRGELFKMVVNGTIYGFKYCEVSKTFRIQAYTKNVTELI